MKFSDEFKAAASVGATVAASIVITFASMLAAEALALRGSKASSLNVWVRDHAESLEALRCKIAPEAQSITTEDKKVDAVQKFGRQNAVVFTPRANPN